MRLIISDDSPRSRKRGRPPKGQGKKAWSRRWSTLRDEVTPKLVDPLTFTPIYQPGSPISSDAGSRQLLMYEIWSASTRGLRPLEISRFLGISTQLVQTYLRQAKAQDAFHFSMQTQEYIAKKFWISSQDRVQKTWQIYNSPKGQQDGHLQIKCIALAHLIEKDMIAIGQSLGLVGKYDAVTSDPDILPQAKLLLDRYSKAVASLVPNSVLIPSDLDPTPTPPTPDAI